MIDYSKFYSCIQETELKSFENNLGILLQHAVKEINHGDLEQWKMLLEQLPHVKPSFIELNRALIKIGTKEDMAAQNKMELEKLLKKFHPWRKGPYDILGIYIDAEWRSGMKWDRFKDHIKSLQGRIILDVGCGNGYYCWRMAGAGARLVVGIEHYLLNLIQFQSVNHFIKSDTVFVLPISFEQFPHNSNSFDTVFSMGVFSHSRSPIDHLTQLRGQLKSGGELVLETLVIDGGQGQVLLPEDRYTKMRNVWFIPSSLTLESWLKRCRFKNIRLIHVANTTSEEQRATEWMHFESLSDYLDPSHPTRTIEGLPAPQRAIFLAEAP